MNTKIELEPEVIASITSGRKIDAIKKLRELRGLGLKEAKELVDLYASENNIATPSVEKVNSGGGFIFLIILGVAGYFIFEHFS